MPWYVAVYEVLLQVSLAGCALLVLATVAVTLLREPARKARVIELTMLGLIALPALVLVPGYPRVALLPAEVVEHREEVGRPRVDESRMIEPRVEADARIPLAEPGAELQWDPPVQPPALPGDSAVAGSPGPNTSPAIAADSQSSTPAPAETRASQPPRVATPASPRPERSLFDNVPTDFRFWIVVGYFTGVVIMLGYSLLGIVAIRRLVGHSHAADDSLSDMLHEIAGPANGVRLLISSRVAQPCAFGWLRPTIVLPEHLVQTGDARQIRFALAHEWSHVSRGDLRAWLLSSVARVLHFQQPLVWLLRGRLRLAQDYLADAAAAGTATSLDYAEFLTAISQTVGRPQLAPGLGIADRRSDLHRRVVMLVENDRTLERTAPRRWNVLALLLVISCVAAVASLRAEQQSPTAGTPSEVPDKEGTLASETNASGSEVPPELRPDRIRAAQSRYGEIEAALHADPTLRKLRQQLKELVRDESRRSLDSPLPAEPRGRRDQQLHLLKLIEQREAEVWKSVVGSKPMASADPAAPSEGVSESRIEIDGILYSETVDPATGKTTRRALGQDQLSVAVTPNEGQSSGPEQTGDTPLELRPERSREVANQHSQVTIDAELFDLQRLLSRLKKTEDASELERNTLLKQQIETVELRIALREAQLSGLRHGPNARQLSALEQFLRIDNELRQLHAIQKDLAKQPDKEEEARRVSQEILRCEQDIHDLLKAHRSASANKPIGVTDTTRPTSDKQIEALLAEDSLIAQLKEKLRAYQEQLERSRAVAAPNSNFVVELQREVLQIEEAIIERKAELRSRVVEYLSHETKSRTGKGAAAPHSNSPFFGTIRPGDILRFDIVGGFPAQVEPIRTVEPDGNLPLGAVYAPKSRIHVAGKTLIEAGQHIENELRTLLKDPHVLLTYEGHDGGVVPTGQGRPTSEPQVRSPVLEVVLQPLDTIEVTLGAEMNNAAFPNGTYLIEPDGTVALFDRRLKLADMSEHDAGEALRAYMSSQPWLLKAPPSIHVQRRGRAVFPENKTPTADYRVQPGDRLLASSIGSAVDGRLLTVSDDGMLAHPEDFVGQKLPPVEVQGKTLDEVQQVLRADWKFPNGLPQNLVEYPWTVTYGGWHEEADPAIIDRIEGGDSPRVEQLEQELREIKRLIRESNR